MSLAGLRVGRERLLDRDDIFIINENFEGQLFKGFGLVLVSTGLVDTVTLRNTIYDTLNSITNSVI